MKSIRFKALFFVLTILVVSVFTKTQISSKVYADNPNQKTTMSSLTGGWDQAFIGYGGNHWTRYSQIPQGGKIVIASIQIVGKIQEVEKGNTTSAYVKSQYKVGPYEPHKHGGGIVK